MWIKKDYFSKLFCAFYKPLCAFVLLGSLFSFSIASSLTPSSSLTHLPKEDYTSSDPLVDDPWEDVNRSVFNFNQDLDTYVLTPLTDIYKGVLPQNVRESIHRFLSNLETPVIFFNDVFQGEGDRAMDTLARALINTSLGLGGLFDPATEIFNIQIHQEDFGQTLGRYGIRGEPYLVLPVFGPSNPRDMVGIIVDFFVIDPIPYVARQHDKGYLNSIRFGASALDKRIAADEVIKGINQAYDPYIRMKSLYHQNREFNIHNGSVDLESPTPVD